MWCDCVVYCVCRVYILLYFIYVVYESRENEKYGFMRGLMALSCYPIILYITLLFYIPTHHTTYILFTKVNPNCYILYVYMFLHIWFDYCHRVKKAVRRGNTFKGEPTVYWDFIEWQLAGSLRTYYTHLWALIHNFLEYGYSFTVADIMKILKILVKRYVHGK